MEKNACITIENWYFKILTLRKFHTQCRDFTKCVNNTTLLGESLITVPKIYMFFLHEHKKLYGFDIRELSKLKANPYTGTIRPHSVQIALQSQFRSIARLPEYEEIHNDSESDLSMHSKISRLIAFISNKYSDYNVGDMAIDSITYESIDNILCYLFIISQNQTFTIHNNYYLTFTTNIIKYQRWMDDEQLLTYSRWQILEFIKSIIENNDLHLPDVRIRMSFLREVWYDVTEERHH
jgi:hypothetical protein